jgi:uncharacterized protein YegL
MSLLDKDTVNIKTNSGYAFSTIALEKLGASEYTLVGIACDVSGSVGGFGPELIGAIKVAAESCSKSPRAENLTIRVTTFNSSLDEFHGFDFLKGLDVSRYDTLLNRLGGSTALYAATREALEAIESEGARLAANEIAVNGILFVITDGCDNVSRETPEQIKKVIERIKKDEHLESIKVVLIGVNVQDPSVKRELEKFHKDAALDQYVDVGEASKGKLAKLADFVSRSVSSTSQALGTGGPSQSLSF